MGRFRFFRRKGLKFKNAVPNWEIAEPENYDAFLYAPVVDGMWRQHEVWDGTYTLGDLLDAHEMMAVKNENEHRAYEQAEMESKMK